MISLSTPFSLETASTTIRISLFIVRPPAARGSSLGRQVRLANSCDRQHVPLALHLDFDRSGPAVTSEPLKRRRPPSGCASSTNTCSPTNRAKCAGVLSGRSSPGEDTSSVYCPGTGSATSSSSLTARLTRSQSSTVIPASASMYRRTKPLPRPGEYSSSQSSYPSSSTIGLNIASSVSLSIRPSFRRAQKQKKMGRRPIRFSRPGRAFGPPQMKNPRSGGFLSESPAGPAELPPEPACSARNPRQSIGWTGARFRGARIL